ncbi:MAG: hypothetical protein JXR89_12100 [Deltaproteobacteria bacterium]|nr:hypothetical protein [Deltaproteobacteria bacterium]
MSRPTRRSATGAWAGRSGFRKRIEQAAALAVRAREDDELAGFVVGLDLAGDENRGRPKSIAPKLEEVFAHCLPVTIHAGEGSSADAVWQAAYHLHADRIGHGLTLVENQELMKRFRDRNICVEMCPSSNLEVVGFYEPGSVDPLCERRYPLKELWHQGLPLTICTDNPGISRTTLSREYLLASRLVDGLSRWEALALIKQGFAHAFSAAVRREALLKKADRLIYDLIGGGK